jgi:hypothetical protein
MARIRLTDPHSSVRPFRLFLLVLLLAWLPLQGWAGTLAHADRAGNTSTTTAVAVADSADDAPSLSTAQAAQDPAGDSSTPFQDARDTGADPAEQLLPVRLAPPPFVVVRADPPGYHDTALPDPHLPRLARPPRA